MVLWRGEKGGGKQLMAKELRHFVQTQAATFLAVECDSRLDYDLRITSASSRGLAKMEETWQMEAPPPHVGRLDPSWRTEKTQRTEVSGVPPCRARAGGAGLLGATTDQCPGDPLSDIHLGVRSSWIWGRALAAREQRRIPGVPAASHRDGPRSRRGPGRSFQRFCEDSLFRHACSRSLVAGSTRST